MPLERPSLDGCLLYMQRRDGSQEGADVIDALSERYETESVGEAGHLLRVTVDDARFPDEAVVRLASVLDEIDRDWASRLSWPKVTAPDTDS